MKNILVTATIVVGTIAVFRLLEQALNIPPSINRYLP